MAPAESIRDLVEPVLAAAGLELWDVEVIGDIVRISVDRPGGVDLDTLTAASNTLSPMLDEHSDLVPDHRYQLEVSSPGVERRLRTPEQFRRFLGSLVSVKTSTPVAGTRRLKGQLVDAGAEAIVVEPEGLGGERVEIPYEQVDRARTVLVWGPAPPPHRRGATHRREARR